MKCLFILGAMTTPPTMDFTSELMDVGNMDELCTLLYYFWVLCGEVNNFMVRALQYYNNFMKFLEFY